MTYSYRKRLFIIFTIIFFITVPVIVLYAQGYRVDFQNKKLVKTGGIDLNLATLDTKIYLDDKLKRETSFLFRNAIFRNIIPKTYNVRIEKENYIPWEKNVLVESEQVTRFPSIRLFPQTLLEFTVAKNVERVFISPNSKYSLIQQTPTAPETKKQVILMNLENSSLSPVFDLNENETIVSVEWNKKSTVSSIKTERRVFLVSIDDVRSPKNWTNFLSVNLPEAFGVNSKIVPTNSPNAMFVVRPGVNAKLNVAYLDIESGVVNSNLLQQIISLDILDNDIFYLDDGGLVHKLNVSENNNVELSPTAIAKPQVLESKVRVRNDGGALLVINNKDLFLWQKDSHLQRIGSDIKDARWNGGEEKLIYWNTNKVYVYWLKTVFGPPQRFVADREIIEVDNIKNAYWAFGSENYLAIETTGPLVMASTDYRDTRQVVSYDLQRDTDLFSLNLNQESIYVIVNNDLVRLTYK